MLEVFYVEFVSMSGRSYHYYHGSLFFCPLTLLSLSSFFLSSPFLLSPLAIVASCPLRPLLLFPLRRLSIFFFRHLSHFSVHLKKIVKTYLSYVV